MLNKKFRFHSRGGVRYVYQHGKTVRSSKMSLVFCDNARKYTRFAVVVSKKVEKSAVLRNRIRRRVYEIIRKNLDKIPKERDYIVVIFSRDVLNMKYMEVEKILGELVEESRVCYNKTNG